MDVIPTWRRSLGRDWSTTVAFRCRGGGRGMAVRHVERHPLCPRRSLSPRWLRPSRAARSDSRRSARGLACPVSVVVPRHGSGVSSSTRWCPACSHGCARPVNGYRSACPHAEKTDRFGFTPRDRTSFDFSARTPIPIPLCQELWSRLGARAPETRERHATVSLCRSSAGR